MFIVHFLFLCVSQGFLLSKQHHNHVSPLYVRKYPITKYKAPSKLPPSPPPSHQNETDKIMKRRRTMMSNELLTEITQHEELDMKQTSKLIEKILRKYNNNNTTNTEQPTPDQPEIPDDSQGIPLSALTNRGDLRIIINNEFVLPNKPSYRENQEPDEETDDESENYDMFGNPYIQKHDKKHSKKDKKSDNFEIVSKSPYTFSDVGGYENIKSELDQCIDILCNYSKYAAYNVRVPKGLIFEGSPGNGKTLIAKALAGEANTSFIAVSGSEFQDKYVGVGANKIRELFELAKKNIPCIIFIDEIDALGRKRSSDGESSSSERDNTLNELLVALDGFKSTSGVFLIGATNRADLLDSALIRPGRIDKRIFIGNPDRATRAAIIDIHVQGKPFDASVNIDDLVDQTNGLSGAQIENILNEAMLHALRFDRSAFTYADIEVITNKIMAGWQPTEHEFSDELIEQIAIHELGHAVVGMICKHHPKMTKVVVNLFSPKSPAYTVFESTTDSISTREALTEHLMILLAGRAAEEEFYNHSITTGAINDFEEALKMAEKMICYYGMGKTNIYPRNSEKYKEMIDTEIYEILNETYIATREIIRDMRELIYAGSVRLNKDRILRSDTLLEMMNNFYLDRCPT